MRGVEHGEAGTWDVVFDVFVGFGRRCRIVLAGYDERRGFDLRQQLALVHVADRFRAGEIAFERSCREYLLHQSHYFRRALAESLVNQRSMFAAAKAATPFSRTSLRRSFHIVLSAK